MLGIQKMCRRVGPRDINNILRRRIHRKSSYYDALGVSPKASQEDIKTAFYQLSMQFHPDKATGNEAKFREISAAYEVLGNLKLRRMYDKGYLPVGASNSNYSSYRDVENYADNETAQQTEDEYINVVRREKRPPMSGRSSAYNYDEWFRNHYGQTFARSRTSHSRVQPQASWMNRSYQQQNARLQRTQMFLFTLCCLSMVFMAFDTMTSNLDKPQKRPRSED